ncbi:MAG: MFS transporter [Sulfurimonas sp.]|jgi:MFS family permease|nr:MFS transporter [Sulfurimonas sp.]MBU3940078.1 MFS transporter [bacterium]MBU4025784.1 MFS transporter [bacterium]MBU4059276.1 MFS transporter [bacterium]MBU4111519.1 MFS transporter [bacterium]
MHSISKFTLVTLLLLSMTTMMSNVAIVTTVPHLKDYFSCEPNIEFLSRLMITFPSLAIALLAPFLGHLIFRFGKKNAAILGLFFFALFGSTGLYLDDISWLLASRFLFGIAVAVLMIVSTSFVGDYFSGEERHKFMGRQSAFSAVGGVIFVFGGGILADIDWRYAFGIYLIGLFLIPLSIKFLQESKREEALDEESLNNRLFGIYILAFILMLFFYILPTQIPFLIINHFGASSTLAGAIISTAFVANAFGALAFAKLKKKLSHPAIFLLSMSIIALGFILIGFVDDVRLFFLTSPVMGFGGGLAMTNVVAWMLSRAHYTKRVKSSGYLTSAIFLGQFSSPILFHPFVSYFGVRDFFIFVGVVLALSVVIALLRKKILA